MCELIQEIHLRKILKGSGITKSFNNFGIGGSKFKQKTWDQSPPKRWVAQTLTSTLLIESQLGRESHHFTTYLTDARDDNLHVLFFTLSQKSLSIKKIESSLGFIFKFKFVVAFRKGVNCQPGAFITFLHLISIRRRS